MDVPIITPNINRIANIIVRMFSILIVFKLVNNVHRCAQYKQIYNHRWQYTVRHNDLGYIVRSYNHHYQQ